MVLRSRLRLGLRHHHLGLGLLLMAMLWWDLRLAPIRHLRRLHWLLGRFQVIFPRVIGRQNRLSGSCREHTVFMPWVRGWVVGLGIANPEGGIAVLLCMGSSSFLWLVGDFPLKGHATSRLPWTLLLLLGMSSSTWC